MRYVILRDDDTCSLTPPAYLETLYRPWLERNFPVNLAVIPNVKTSATWRDGSPEGFLVAKQGELPANLPIGEATELLAYLKANPLFKPVLHGYEHDYLEFTRTDPAELERRITHGFQLFSEAGLPRPTTFVAPYDQLSTNALRLMLKHLRILSTGWYSLRNLPVSWWPGYFHKKLSKKPHWKVGQLKLLSHPGCLLSHKRNLDTMLETIRRAVAGSELTVLVTHWWEYFPNNRPFTEYISVFTSDGGFPRLSAGHQSHFL